jgi:hypothetical protein
MELQYILDELKQFDLTEINLVESDGYSDSVKIYTYYQYKTNTNYITYDKISQSIKYFVLDEKNKEGMYCGHFSGNDCFIVHSTHKFNSEIFYSVFLNFCKNYILNNYTSNVQNRYICWEKYYNCSCDISIEKNKPMGKNIHIYELTPYNISNNILDSIDIVNTNLNIIVYMKL